MSELENTDMIDQEAKLENHPKKRVRHRKKQLYENILRQMEFYFSDANLTKDRYLGDLVRRDPYVPLEIFLKFNKVRTMTQDIADIAKAMKHSTLLELSEDRLKVRRKVPVLPYDADSRTVYVESIPVTATREWLSKVFSEYGQVAYISLPKFKNSQKIKGFGFIEYVKPEDAQKCLDEFNKMGCKLPICMPPEELSSIKMFSMDEPLEEPEHKEEKEDLEPPKKKKKKEKRLKNSDHKSEYESDNEKCVDTPVETDSKDEISQDEDNVEITPRKTKARKRAAKEKMRAKNGFKDAAKGPLWGLLVLAKGEWKSLRNKYLNLQRKYMKEVKSSLHTKRHLFSGIPAPAVPPAEVESAQGIGAENSKLLERIPGVFVKEHLPEPCLDIRHTKRMIRSNVHALHVDVKEGQTEVIIRFDSAQAADEYCAMTSNRARVLSGGEEEQQWSLAQAALSSKRERGRSRLLARRDALGAAAALAPASPQPTHTHIRFDE